jgi:hypothetical protein
MNDDDLPATKGDLRKMRRTLQSQIVQSDLSLDRLEKNFRSEIRMDYSLIVARIDEAIGRSAQLDHAQVIADWRRAHP